MQRGRLKPHHGLFVWVLVLIPVALMRPAAAGDTTVSGRTMARQAVQEQPPWITADHSRHEALRKTFSSGNAITRTCLSCHNDADAQFRETIHWTWIDPLSTAGRLAGKGGHSINNFCLSTNFMKDPKCLDCHPGWNGKNEEINCLRCHGRKKIDWRKAFDAYNALAQSENPADRAEALRIQQDIQGAAQSVGLPQRDNCGSCHFFGGGGDGVKHGDLDSSMANPDKQLDVHMGIDGRNFRCTRCHTTRRHHVAGRIYATPAVRERKSLLEDDLTPKIACEACHGAEPHRDDAKQNDHVDKVACQSCHIPEFARRLPTKMRWDWSKAGQRRDGQAFEELGPFGKPVYRSIKGAMEWTQNGIPEYFWFSGAIDTLSVEDVIDPAGVVNVSWPVGGPADANARIFPFKVHRGRQPYDTLHKTLLPPLLSGPKGFWTTLDWPEALRTGAELMSLPFSGQFDFVETRYVFPTTHMVAPKEKALRCEACHTRNGSRLADLTGFYMPRRDRWAWVDFGGWVLVMAVLAFSGIHALGRIISGRRRKDGDRA